MPYVCAKAVLCDCAGCWAAPATAEISVHQPRIYCRQCGLCGAVSVPVVMKVCDLTAALHMHMMFQLLFELTDSLDSAVALPERACTGM